MADSRYQNGVYVGAPMTTQQALNQRLKDYCDAHPASYGWTDLRFNKQYQLPVYHKDGVELMRHPDGGAWLVQYLDICRRSECHISEITEKLETIKLQFEFEIAKEQFTADIERLAA